MKKCDAIKLLLQLFEDNSLSFRDIAQLKSVFDEATEICNDIRSEQLAEHHFGRRPLPKLFDRDTEDDFFDSLKHKASAKLGEHGVKGSEGALDAIVDFAYETAEFEPSDFYYNR